MNAITLSTRPGLLGNTTLANVFENLFSDFPRHLEASTSGYPVADIYRDEDDHTVLEFALAGFTKEDLTVDVLPAKRSITVSADAIHHPTERPNRRIAQRAFKRTYVNYDDNLDLSGTVASFENGLLTVRVPPRPEAQPLSIDINCGNE